MLTCYWMRGLPASGKSTKSKQILKDDSNAVRVNKDELRELLDVKATTLDGVFDREILRRMTFMENKRDAEQDAYITGLKDELLRQFSPKKDDFMKSKAGKLSPRERLVIGIQTVCVRYAVSQGKNLIVDDTNYNPEHYSRISGYCKGYQFKITDMHRDFGVTMQQCLDRNAARDRVVPKVAILSMAKQYKVFDHDAQAPAQKPFVTDLPKVVIFDTDGTLADCTHRQGHLNRDNGGRPNWTAFFEEMDKDEPREHVIGMLRGCYDAKDENGNRIYAVVIVTARPETYRKMTEDWYAKHNVPYDCLIMRRPNDRRGDEIVKQEILDTLLPKDKIDYVVDDRPKVLRMWRRNGLKVVDVGNGIEF